MCVAGVFSPKRSIKVKYSQKVKGGFTPSAFKDYKLPTSIVNALVAASNQSLALNTWSNYRVVESHLQKCERDTGVRIRFPMDNREMMYIDKPQQKPI